MGTTISDSPKPQSTSAASDQSVSEETSVSTAPPAPQQDPQVAAKNTKASKQYAAENKSGHDMRGQLIQKSLADQLPSAPPKQVLTASEHFAPGAPAARQLLTADEHFAPNNPTLFSASTDSAPGSSQATSQNSQAKPAGSPFVKLQSAKPGSEAAVNNKMLDEAAQVLRNARPGQEAKVIETLARVKEAVTANGGNFFPFLSKNMDAIQGLLGPFGLRPMEAPQTVNLQLENFDRAVQRFRTMTPGDREAVRHPLSNPQGAFLVNRIAVEEAPSRKEQTEAQQRDPNRILTKLPDGTLYSGYKRDLKDAEEAARNRIAMQKLENIKSSGPLSLVGRVVGTAADGILGTENLGEGLAAVGSLGDAALPGVMGPSAKGRSMAGGPTPPSATIKGRPGVVNSSPPPTRGVRAEEQPRAAGDPWSGRAKVQSNNSSRTSNVGNANTVPEAKTIPSAPTNVQAPPPPPSKVAPNPNAPAPPGKPPTPGPETGLSQPAPPPKVPGKGKTLPGSFYKRQGPEPPKPPDIPGFPTKSGTSLGPDEVLHIHEIDSSRIGWSMSEAEHLRQWKVANPGSKKTPPVAFTTPDGRVVVNEEAWIRSGHPGRWGSEARRRSSED